MKMYIGVDPGNDGGISLLSADGKVKFRTKMPDTVKGITDLFTQWYETFDDLAMIVEKAQAMPKQGVTSAFNYGKGFGVFETIAAILDIPYHDPRPAKWKKEMGLNADKINSIKLCKRLFPAVNLLASDRCRKDHDGIAEAILLAEWGRRNNL
jgi:crossover junction endodeoxyribonuclease RuvC